MFESVKFKRVEKEIKISAELVLSKDSRRPRKASKEAMLNLT